MDNFIGLLCGCMFAAFLWVLWGKVWDWLSEKLKNPLSYLLLGLIVGICLAVLAWIYQGGDFGDLTMLGFHPFWVGFVPVTAWAIIW